jgi:hypothetical protein
MGSAISGPAANRVCAGEMPLDPARKEIAADWIAAYQMYVGEKVASR